MVAFNFQKRFAPMVEDGTKHQTIRAGEPRCKPGDTLQLYVGMRTKGCRKLRDAICAMVRLIEMMPNGTVKIDGRPIGGLAVEELAADDGFENGQAMLDWFTETHGLPVRGYIVNW